ncbi:TPA: hypothetical protein ACGPDF_002165 [Streptococcus suis]|uniref:hypothetical protein n=1 Tax=Lactobacillales TaxID=186826 RepID=UPI000543CC8A|nr:hypothetical protein NC01_10230 [Streptococcus uberis]HDL2512188.1 hypothetical protein [Enterococcus faecium]HEM3666157.1 hypothetical protein [Streptococcus suis]HEM3666283.1 hypothetical protein [Streptococcus suis]HEM3672628.1 hypothetical protein [Streptococcus suis]
MFSKTPVELLVKDFSNIYNKCQSAYELVSSHRYNEFLAILTTAEAYAIAEKAYVRCDTFQELQTPEVEEFVNAFDIFYFELKQVLFHKNDDLDSLYNRLNTMSEVYQKVNNSFDLI